MNARYGKHRWAQTQTSIAPRRSPHGRHSPISADTPKGWPTHGSARMHLGSAGFGSIFFAQLLLAQLMDGGRKYAGSSPQPLGVWRVASLDVNAPIIEVDFEVRNGHRVRTVFRLAT